MNPNFIKNTKKFPFYELRFYPKTNKMVCNNIEYKDDNFLNEILNDEEELKEVVEFYRNNTLNEDEQENYISLSYDGTTENSFFSRLAKKDFIFNFEVVQK